MKASKPIQNIDSYIATFPGDVQGVLKKLRQTIKKAAPGVEETIGYGMPAFKLNDKYLVFFAAWKNHIGFYPIPSGIKAFKKELSSYKMAKGSIQFPIERPLPFALIKKIVLFRVKENLVSAKSK